MTLLQSDGRWPCLKIGNNPGCGSSFANRYGVVRHMESVHQRTLEKKKGYHPADGYLFEYDRVAHQKPTASFDEHLLADLSTTATPMGAGVSFVSLTRGRGRARGRAPASAAPAAIGAPGAAVPVPAAAAQMPAAAAQVPAAAAKAPAAAAKVPAAAKAPAAAQAPPAAKAPAKKKSRRSRRGGQDHPNPNKVPTVEKMEVDALPVLVPASKVTTGQGRGTRLREMLAAAEAKAGSSGFQVGPNYAHAPGDRPVSRTSVRRKRALWAVPPEPAEQTGRRRAPSSYARAARMCASGRPLPCGRAVRRGPRTSWT